MKKLTKAVAVILSLIVMLSVFSSVGITASAAAGDTKVVLTLGDSLLYQTEIDWRTHEMFADGKMAYCVNPKLPAPSGTFRTSDSNCIELSSHPNYTYLYKALYYCYGGDGFKKEVTAFQTTVHTYSGNNMSAFMGNLKSKYSLYASSSDLHYLMTHRVLAYFYGDSDWNYALISAWCDAIMEIVNAIKKAPDVPKTTKLYILDTGNSSYQKVILAKNLVKLQLQKTSSAPDLTDNNDCYSLADAIYNIYLDKNCTEYFGYIRTNSSGFGKYGAGANGVNVPLQTYYAKEQTAPQGYALDSTVYEFKNSGKTADGVPVYSISCEDTPQNDPVYILLRKNDENGAPLEGAEFTVSYYKGYYNSQSELSGVKPERSWVFKTNENGFIGLSDDYLISGDEFYYATNSGNPALPLGTVVIQETKAPTGYQIDKDNNFFIRQITSEGQAESVFTYNAPEVTNEEALTPSITTTAKNKAYNSNTAYVSTSSTIVDIVSYSGLKANTEYTVKGKLMDKSTGKALIVNNKEVVAEKTFTPAESNGTVEMEFTFDSTALAGKSVVAYEYLYCDEASVATHTDINDLSQTVTFKEPKIQTTVKDAYTGINEGYMDELTEWVEFNDTVSYSDLIVGAKYTVKGKLIDKSTGKEFLVNGNTITGEETFIPTTSSGEVDVEYIFTGVDVLGKSVVAYEYLYCETSDGSLVQIASHEDINDENQTYYIRNPKISTKAKDSFTNSNGAFVTSTSTTIIDTVTYSDIVPGYDYSLTGWLVDKETGKQFGETKEMTYTPTESSGTVDMTFTFDSTGLEGKSIVVFETFDLIDEESGVQFVTSHMDLNDENQTITFYGPSISTNAKDKETGTGSAFVGSSTTIIDTVSYSGLVPGVEYTLKGEVIDKETDSALLIDGDTVTAEAKFIPTETDGEAEVKFTFNSTGLENKELVVFEYLYIQNELITQHCDLHDGNQTITFNSPTISTIAKDSRSGSNSAFPSDTSNILDTVNYTGLIPNVEYRLHGVLMDQETGKELVVDGKTVTAEKTFTPTEGSGSEEMKFTLDSTTLKDKSIVVFEYLEIVNEDEGNREIACHTDINDSNQTITYKDQSLITAARDSVTGTNKGYISGGSTIIDKISYNGLIPNEKYIIETKLVDKETGNSISNTATTSFTPAEADGEIEVSISFSSIPYKGKSVVVYEALRYNGSIIATHEDINDPNQTVEFLNPSVETTAVDKETNSHEGYSSDKTTIVDTVQMKGLIVGGSYEVNGVLMDKSTNSEFLVNGEKVTAAETFTAVSEEQEIEIEFSFDSSALGNLTVVAFETLSYKYISSNNSEKYTTVAAHKDINDEGQTVTIFGEGDIKFIKVDENDNPLSGVSFEIYSDESRTTLANDVNGNTFNTYITDETGIVEFNDLLYGTYYIVEIKTVNGNQLLPGVIVAEVTKDGTTLSLNGKYLDTMEIINADGETEEISKVTNALIPNLPFTGGSGILMYVVVGILLVGFSIVAFVPRKKKREGAEI